MQNRVWYLPGENGSVGPYTLEELAAWKAQIPEGQDVWLWREGLAGWIGWDEALATSVRAVAPAVSNSPLDAPPQATPEDPLLEVFREEEKKIAAPVRKKGRLVLLLGILLLALIPGYYFWIKPMQVETVITDEGGMRMLSPEEAAALFSDTRPPGGLYDAVSDTSAGSAAATTQATDTMSGEVMPVAENSPSGQPAPETGAR
jgi:hypothetical protein